MSDSERKLLWLRALLIIAAGVWVFSPALQGDWLMDDDFYLYQNALMNDPARLWKTWFVPGSLIEYYPLEASVQAIQWHYWHIHTLGYHLTNVVLHVIGGLLVWCLLAKFGLRFAWLGGLVFVIHPTAVESVAWISELKNTLSLPPFLLAMCAWIDFQEYGKKRDYFLALLLFLIAMLCKVSMALFPFVILLYAWWKSGRIARKDLQGSLPFFLISFVLGLLTILAGNWYREAHLQPTPDPDIGGYAARWGLAGSTITFYFFKCVWPSQMLPIYPKWPVDPHSLLTYLLWIGLIGILLLFWSQRRSWGRHALLGVGFFLLNLLPFVGFNSVTFMGFTWVMDHFLYIPIIGLIGLAVAIFGQIETRLTRTSHVCLAGATALILSILAIKSYAYAGIFIGPEKLWTYTTQYNPTSFTAHNNLGNVYTETGRIPQAIDQYRKALELNPHMVEAQNNLGRALYEEGKIAEAIQNYESALKDNPHYGVTLVNLGNALAQNGRIAEAVERYKEALQVNPDDKDTRSNLEKLLTQQKSSRNESE